MEHGQQGVAGLDRRRRVHHERPEAIAFALRHRRRSVREQLGEIVVADGDGARPEERPQIRVRHVVVPREGDVSRIARHAQVRHALVEGDPVEGCVSLDEAPVLLHREIGEDVRVGARQHVDPGRDARERCVEVRRLEDEQCADPLHPGGAALGRRTDHDVVRAELESVPARAVVDEVLVVDPCRAGHVLPPDPCPTGGRYRPRHPVAARPRLPAGWPCTSRDGVLGGRPASARTAAKLRISLPRPAGPGLPRPAPSDVTGLHATNPASRPPTQGLGSLMLGRPPSSSPPA